MGFAEANAAGAYRVPRTGTRPCRSRSTQESLTCWLKVLHDKISITISFPNQRTRITSGDMNLNWQPSWYSGSGEKEPQ